MKGLIRETILGCVKAKQIVPFHILTRTHSSSIFLLKNCRKEKYVTDIKMRIFKKSNDGLSHYNHT